MACAGNTIHRLAANTALSLKPGNYVRSCRAICLYNKQMKIVSTGRTLFSEETYEKKREERKRKLVLWGSFLLILFVALILATRISGIQIKEIKVEGARVITSDEIARNVRETLEGKYYLLVPKSNSLLYPGDEIKENLLEEFPRFGAVELSLDGLNTITVYVSERNPYALYCPNASRPQDASSCYFLDDTGFIFDEAPAFSGVVYFIYSTDPAIENPKGKEFLEVSEFQNLTVFLDAVRGLGFEPTALQVGETESKLLLPDNAQILWNRKDDLNHLYQNLEAFMQNPAIQAETNFMGKISSLDLRTENKVFYRFK